MAHTHNKAPRVGRGRQEWFNARVAKDKAKRKAAKAARRKNRK